MPRLVQIASRQDIPSSLSDGPVGRLLEYHNLNRPYDNYDAAELLVGMCMDNRMHLRIPDNFAFVIRLAGANLKPAEFMASFAIAVGGIRALALITHTQCAMVGVADCKSRFIEGLVDGAGWNESAAEEHFTQSAPTHDIGDEVAFALTESDRLSRVYPRIRVVPLLYRIEDSRLYLIQDR